ncbi:MAG: hypothetical protein JJ878_03405 [Alphaproteobacteria bacterium]|nr:hypothetical protein [Alphaproteobacteria bacterium]MBO6861659.1 hypothetical protein [Alphaproteobacteria bacterium]
MALNSIQLASQALIKIGAMPISSFDDGSAESTVAAALYATTRDALLSAHPWNFATAQRDLPRLETGPVADYDCAFQLPVDFLRALSAGGGGRGRGVEYRIAENRLHADIPAITLTYIYRPVENAFPAFFDEALIARLAAEYCLPLTESTSRADALHRLAEERVRTARLIDAQQDTPARFVDFTLVEVRG